MGPILIHKQMGRRLIIGSWQPDKRNVDVFISDAATGTADDPYLLCPAVRECPPFTSVESTAGGKKHSLNLSPAHLQRQPESARISQRGPFISAESELGLAAVSRRTPAIIVWIAWL